MKNGFTFLELLIAIFAFTTGVLGSFLMAQYFIFDTQISMGRLSAIFLAQEGMEIVRNIRDDNWLKNRDWDNGLSAGDWKSDYDDNGLFSGSDEFLKSETDGFYNYNSGASTKFKRKITITPVDAAPDDYLKIVVSVQWTEKGKDYTVAIQENLYPWY